MSGVITYLPRPFCELGVIWTQNQAYKSLAKDAEQKRIVFRLAITVMQVFLYYKGQTSTSTIAWTGIALSLPATYISLGLGLIHLACQKVFQNLPTAAVCFAAGWFLLEKHEVLQWGFLERFLPQSNVLSPPPFPSKPTEEKWIEKHRYIPYVDQKTQIERLSKDWDNLKKFANFEEDEDQDLGVFNYKSIGDKLSSENVVEFFYCYDDIDSGRTKALEQGVKTTGKGQQQIFYSCFANTFKRSFICGGVKWESRAHYYYAQKFHEGSETYVKIQKAQDAFEIARNLSKETKKLEYQKDLRISTSEASIKWKNRDSILVVFQANLAYFGQHKADRELLLSTDNLPLIERNERPTVWGISSENDNPAHISINGKKINRNRQGWILMYLRNHFRSLA